MDSIPESGEVHTSTKSVQTETDDESSESSSEGEESGQYGSSSDESDNDNKDDKKEDNYSSYSSSSDSEDDNGSSSSDGSSTLSDDDEPKQPDEDVTTVVHVPNNDIGKKVKNKEDLEQKAEVIKKDDVNRDAKEVQTLPPDTKETSMQTTPRNTNSVPIQTSPRSDENKEKNDKQNDSTLEKEETLPVNNGIPIEKQSVEKQRNNDTEVKLETTSVQTTLPDMLDISMQTSQRDLRASSMQTAPRDTRNVIVQTSPRTEKESRPFENVVLVENIERQRNSENQNSRKVGTQTKPLHKPIENPLHVEKESRTAETMTIKVEKDDTDTQTINEKVDKQTQAKIKRDRPSTPSSYVSSSASSPGRSSLSLLNVPDRPSAPEPIVDDSDKTDERSSSESEIFVDDVPLVPPKVKPPKKKKLSREKKEDLALLKKLLKHHKLPRKPKKHPLSPDPRRVPKPQQINEKNNLEKRSRPKPVQDDSVICKTRMKTGSNSGRGVSLAAFRLYLYKIS